MIIKTPSDGDERFSRGGNLPSQSRVFCSRKTPSVALPVSCISSCESKPVLKVHKRVLRSVDGWRGVAGGEVICDRYSRYHEKGIR